MKRFAIGSLVASSLFLATACSGGRVLMSDTADSGQGTMGGSGCSSCSGATPFCNPSTNACECTSSSCTGGQFCKAGSCSACTIADLADAAAAAKTAIESMHHLPETISVCSQNVSMETFLEQSVTAVLAVASAQTGDPIVFDQFGSPPIPRDDTHHGQVQQAEYLKIAGDVKSFMDQASKAPEYAYNTSLGLHMGFTNLVCLYDLVLASYHSTGTLPASVDMQLDWWCTVAELAAAAAKAKSTIEADRRLPTNIWGLSQPTFLEASATAVLAIASGDTNKTIPLKDFASAPNPRDTTKHGQVQKDEYLKITNDVKSFMDSQGVAPEYAYNTRLGWYMGFVNLVYMYDLILSDYNSNGKLGASVDMQLDWSCTIDDIASAAGKPKQTIQSTKNLPASNEVYACCRSLSTPTFLNLEVAAVLDISNGTTTASFTPTVFAPPPSPVDDVKAGNMPETEYLTIATNVKIFMDDRKVAPEYAYNTSLGLHLGFTNLVYMYAAALDSYSSNRKLPDGAPVLQLTSNPLSPVIGWQQFDTSHDSGSCGSHAGAVAMAYFRGTTNDSDGMSIEHWIYDGVPLLPASSDLLSRYNEYMNDNGIPYSAYVFGDPGSVLGLIQSGTPVVAHTTLWGGHYVTVYGLIGDTVYISDGVCGDGGAGILTYGNLKTGSWAAFTGYVVDFIGFSHK